MILEKIVAMLAIYGKILIEKVLLFYRFFVIYLYNIYLLPIHSVQECIDLFLFAGTI